MSSVRYLSAGGNRVDYPYWIGKIEWDNQEINAFVVGGFPVDGGLEISGSIAVNYLLANNQELSKDRWAVFIKLPAYIPGSREWKLIGSGIGTKPLPKGALWDGEVPDEITKRLQSIIGS